MLLGLEDPAAGAGFEAGGVRGDGGDEFFEVGVYGLLVAGGDGGVVVCDEDLGVLVGW